MADLYRKKRREKKRREAEKLDRPGYWACKNCFVHNPDIYLRCSNCGVKKGEEGPQYKAKNGNHKKGKK